MTPASNTPSVLRSKCRWCGYSVRLRRNGLLQRHILYTDRTWVCPGGEIAREPRDRAPHPVAYFLEDPDLYPHPEGPA